MASLNYLPLVSLSLAMLNIHLQVDNNNKNDNTAGVTRYLQYHQLNSFKDIRRRGRRGGQVFLRKVKKIPPSRNKTAEELVQCIISNVLKKTKSRVKVKKDNNNDIVIALSYYSSLSQVVPLQPNHDPGSGASAASHTNPALSTILHREWRGWGKLAKSP